MNKITKAPLPLGFYLLFLCRNERDTGWNLIVVIKRVKLKGKRMDTVDVCNHLLIFTPDFLCLSVISPKDIEEMGNSNCILHSKKKINRTLEAVC